MSEKQKPKVAITSRIIVTVIIVLVLGTGIYLFTKSLFNQSTSSSSNSQSSVLSATNQRRNRGFPGGSPDISQICNQQNNRGTRPAGLNDNQDSNRPTSPQGQTDIRAKITEVCADGTVSDSEKTELEALFKNMTPPQN